MSAYTPGPWTATYWYNKEAETGGWQFSAAGHLLPLHDMETDNPEEADANARLIAAAPDLLGALDCIVRYLADADEKGLIEHGEPMIAAREAIKKAAGETS